MSKRLKIRQLGAGRTLLAVTLGISISTFGCTTDRTLGNGQPTRNGPEVRSVPTSGVTSGSESAPIPPPMTSSLRVDPGVNNGTVAADQAAALMAQHQRVRVLGPSSPADGPSRMSGAPQAPAGGSSGSIGYTVNQTPFSIQAPAITSGGDAGGSLSGGITSPATVTGGGASTSLTGAMAVTPGSPATGLALMPGSPGTASVVTPGSPVTSAFGPLAPAAGTLVPGAMTSSAIASQTARPLSGMTSASTVNAAVSAQASSRISRSAIRSAGIANPVRIVTTSSGQRVITNVGSR